MSDRRELEEIDSLERLVEAQPPIGYLPPNKLYQYPEWLKHPFFLQTGSKAVNVSRKVYLHGLKNKDKKASKGPMMSEEELTKSYSDGWKIFGSIQYGLPNEFDGHVWDYIKKKIAQMKLSEGKFYNIYFINSEEILKYFINTGILKSRGGKQIRSINDSIYRLFKTTYRYEKGIVVRNRKSKSGQHIEILHSADFNLISSIYRKGQIMENGEICEAQFAITINPMIIMSLQQDYFIITENIKREKLVRFSTKTIYDRFAYWAYIRHRKDELSLLSELKIPYYQIVGYLPLCKIIGVEPLPKKWRQKSRIKKQIENIHEELLEAEIIDRYAIEEYDKGGVKQFNMIYIFNKTFADNIIQFESRAKKDEIIDKKNLAKPTKEKIQKTIKSINAKIRDQEMRAYLLRNIISV